MLENLISVLKEQHHGTSVIFLHHENEDNVKKEVERLCKVNRGTLLQSNIKYSVENGWDKDTLLAITSIDGALVMDWTGCCLAMGVIVDGKAADAHPGDVARGARYNSISTYVMQDDFIRDGFKVIGIIVSEDGMINIKNNFT